VGLKQINLSWESERRTFTVAEITQAIRGVLERDFRDVWVSGEISGSKRAASGHLYFTLKDSEAQIQCACWRNSVRGLRFQPQDGVAVLARGRVEVYPPRGQYQLIVEAMEPQGHGALQLAFEQLKEKLKAEGLFDKDRKRPLPKSPQRIGIVTSPTGAAIRDIVNVLQRRSPGVAIRLYPALVQGEGSVAAVAEGIRFLGQSGWPELLIVGRGGGSLEDLWTFNEEAVARAIAACPVPVVSAVGHETDFTIADFVADLRAPTPSAAAELVVPERREQLDRVENLRRRIARLIQFRIADSRARLHQQGTDRAMSLLRRQIGQSQQQVDDFGFRLRDEIRGLLNQNRWQLQELEGRLRRRDLRLQLTKSRRRLERAEDLAATRMRACLAAAGSRLAPAAAELQQLSPLAVLERGYSIVLDAEGRAVRDAAQAPPGTTLSVRLSKGALGVRVETSDPFVT
jgi:exodeoxyribonuclease VII large subunit